MCNTMTSTLVFASRTFLSCFSFVTSSVMHSISQQTLWRPTGWKVCKTSIHRLCLSLLMFRWQRYRVQNESFHVFILNIFATSITDFKKLLVVQNWSTDHGSILLNAVKATRFIQISSINFRTWGTNSIEWATRAPVFIHYQHHRLSCFFIQPTGWLDDQTHGCWQ